MTSTPRRVNELDHTAVQSTLICVHSPATIFVRLFLLAFGARARARNAHDGKAHTIGPWEPRDPAARSPAHMLNIERIIAAKEGEEMK